MGNGDAVLRTASGSSLKAMLAETKLSFALLSLRGSVSHEDLPYIARLVIFGFMYFGSATSVMFVGGTEVLIDKALQHYLKEPHPKYV